MARTPQDQAVTLPLLDVAIGLIFVYLLLSLICSSLSEGIESAVHNRASDLENGVRILLSEPVRKGGKRWLNRALPWTNKLEEGTFTAALYRHPLIRSLFKDETQLPTYIPAQSFALALMDLVSQNKALVDGASGVNPAKLSQQELEQSLAADLPPNLRRSLVALVAAAGGDAERARVNIENWFNNSMDRVSGWYKRRTQFILFGLAMIITVGMNADTISIFKHLAHSKNLEAIVTAAGNAAGGKLQDEAANATQELKDLDLGLGWQIGPAAPGAVDPSKIPPHITQPCKGDACNVIPWSLYLLGTHFFGWLMTAAALALGAPFWFDILNRIIVVRSTVKPKEKSQNEPPKN